MLIFPPNLISFPPFLDAFTEEYLSLIEEGPCLATVWMKTWLDLG